MNITSYIRNFAAVLLAVAMMSAGPASAWDFDQTRARDIVDRAANDGDPTAQLLLAMALDDRVQTNFDDYPFRLPSGKAASRHIHNLDARDIYRNLMTGPGELANKESLMVYALWGTYALADRDFSRATMYYEIAEAIGEQLIQERGLSPDVTALLHDAKAGKVAAMRCNGQVPEQDTAYKIDRMLAGLERNSGIAKDYRAFIQARIPITRDHPRTLDLEGTGCWAAPSRGATVVAPTAPYDYEINTRKTRGVVQ